LLNAELRSDAPDLCTMLQPVTYVHAHAFAQFERFLYVYKLQIIIIIIIAKPLWTLHLSTVARVDQASQ